MKPLLVLAIVAAAMPSAAQPREVTPEDLERVYEEVKTSHRYGVVLEGEPGTMVDSPSVFRHDDRWYMVYIQFNNIGYETFLAESDDLLAWRKTRRILSQGSGSWDDKQVAGYIALQNTEWGGSAGLGRHNGRYWLSYLGGALEGYETDPLAVGLASTTAPNEPIEWTRLEDNPLLHPHDEDARWFEAVTIYKSHIIRDPDEMLGAPFVMYYNAKSKVKEAERIAMAVSRDLVHWKRLGVEPVIDNESGISGDPQIVRIDDLWVMFYFGAFWRPNAFDTFAVSTDLVHWTQWEGPHLVEPSKPGDQKYAHKPWLIKHDGVVYHFYCAVGDQGRVIALATSKRMSSPTSFDLR